MAFSTTTIAGIKLAPMSDKSPLYDDLVSALSANTASLSALGGGDTLARGVVAFLEAYRADPDAGPKLSAAAVISVAASSTSSLLVLSIQIVPAV